MLGHVSTTEPADLGPNAWMADEMRSQWELDPTSVAPEWRALFEGGSSNGTPAPPAPAAAAPIEVESTEVTRPQVVIPTPMQTATPEPPEEIPDPCP